MSRDICIVHIEDEFQQMFYLPIRVRQYVELYWSNRSGQDTGRTTLTKVANGEDPAGGSWTVYDIVSGHAPDIIVRYIFSSNQRIPQDLSPYILKDSHFIIDLLRVKSDGQGLWSTADDSILSAFKHGAGLSDITIFSACQGSDIDYLISKYPEIRIISKTELRDLNLLLSTIIVTGLDQ